MFASKEWTKSLLNKCFAKRDSYSTSEQKIGTWTDGKTLYRRVFNSLNTGTTLNAANTMAALSSYGITNSNVKRLDYSIKTSAGAFFKDGNIAGTYRIWVDSASKLLELHTHDSLNSLNATVIIEYTK